MQRGSYVEAADTFLDYVRFNAPQSYTVSLGTFCEAGNVTRQVMAAGDAGELFLLPVEMGGRRCYRVLWGLFNSLEEGRRAMSSIPTRLRSPGQLPVPLSRLIR